MGLELTTDKHPSITSQAQWVARLALPTAPVKLYLDVKYIHVDHLTKASIL